jgi:hypothetical protein
MAGIVTEPMAAASAADEPETSEKKIVATITTRPEAAGQVAHEDVREVHEPPPHPPVSRNAPARTKSGTASTGERVERREDLLGQDQEAACGRR